MDRQAAERIVPMLVRAANEAADTVRVFREYAPEDAVKAYAHAVGDVVSAIDGLLRPIIHEYPDLHP